MIRANTYAVVPVAHRRRIGVGTLPACNDTNHSHSPLRKLVVYGIDGFDSGALIADPNGQVWQRSLASSPVDPTHQALTEGRQLITEPRVASTHSPSPP